MEGFYQTRVIRGKINPTCLKVQFQEEMHVHCGRILRTYLLVNIFPASLRRRKPGNSLASKVHFSVMLCL